MRVWWADRSQPSWVVQVEAEEGAVAGDALGDGLGQRGIVQKGLSSRVRDEQGQPLAKRVEQLLGVPGLGGLVLGVGQADHLQEGELAMRRVDPAQFRVGAEGDVPDESVFVFEVDRPVEGHVVTGREVVAGAEHVAAQVLQEVRGPNGTVLVLTAGPACHPEGEFEAPPGDLRYV